MFKNMIDRFLGKSQEPAPDEPPGDSHGRWLTAEQAENPFTVEGVDCVQFVQSMLSATKDPKVAESFTALRNSAGDEYRDQLPEHPLEVTCRLQYRGGEVSDGPLFKAATMEQKWDIYLFGDRFYFCRSWTGVLAYVAQFAATSEALVVSRIWLPGEMVEGDFGVRQVDYLIKSHLLRMRIPHPLPQDLPREIEQIALYSFSQYGNVCCFGTFEETLERELLKPRSA